MLEKVTYLRFMRYLLCLILSTLANVAAVGGQQHHASLGHTNIQLAPGNTQLFGGPPPALCLAPNAIIGPVTNGGATVAALPATNQFHQNGLVCGAPGGIGMVHKMGTLAPTTAIKPVATGLATVVNAVGVNKPSQTLASSNNNNKPSKSRQSTEGEYQVCILISITF